MRKNFLVLQSLLFLTIGTSCNQIKLPNAFVLPTVITELANYHIDKNVYYYNEYTNSNFYDEEDPLYPVSLLAGDYFHDLYNKNGELNGNYSINYNQNLETTNNYSDYPQLINTPFRNYSYVKIKLNDMKGYSLDQLGGVITLHGGDVRNNIDDEKSTFEIKGILYATGDEKEKFLDYFGNRFGFYITKIYDEFGNSVFGSKLDTKYENFYDFLYKNLNKYFGYYFDKTTNTIKYSDSVRERHENEALSFVTEQESNFFNDLPKRIYFNGCMTTTELRDYVNNSEKEIIDNWNSLIFEAYNEAIDYWSNLYYEKVEQINSNNKKINENKKKIKDAEKTISNNNSENERLESENKILESSLNEAIKNYNNSFNIYSNNLDLANKNLEEYNNLNSELELISRNIENLREENRNINKEVSILEEMLNNTSLSEEARENINKRIMSLNANYSINVGEINKLNNEYSDIEKDADAYYSSYEYYKNLADNEKINVDYYSNEIYRLENQIIQNKATIISNNYENVSLTNNIPKWEEEIQTWQDEINNDFIPRRDDYYKKRQDWENKFSDYQNNFKDNYLEEPNERLKEKFDSYYENLINEYREDSVKGVSEQYRSGIDEPDVWDWSSDIYNLNGWKMSGDERTISEELDKYASEEVKKYARNTYPSNGNGFYIVPFNMQSNNRYDLALTEYPIDVLTDGFEFGSAFNQMTLVIQFNYDGMVCRNKNSIMTCLGAFTFSPTAETYEKDRELGNYEDWEIKNMESNKKEEENVF